MGRSRGATMCSSMRSWSGAQTRNSQRSGASRCAPRRGRTVAGSSRRSAIGGKVSRPGMAAAPMSIRSGTPLGSKRKCRAVMPLSLGTLSEHAAEVARGERFEFGENWKRFLDVLDDERIATAVDSLTSMLKVASLEGKRFLDAGSGSGLFSLAARKLGASVVSFDFDPQSVACTRELRRRYFPDDPRWTVEAGSV